MVVLAYQMPPFVGVDFGSLRGGQRKQNNTLFCFPMGSTKMSDSSRYICRYGSPSLSSSCPDRYSNVDWIASSHPDESLSGLITVNNSTVGPDGQEQLVPRADDNRQKYISRSVLIHHTGVPTSTTTHTFGPNLKDCSRYNYRNTNDTPIGVGGNSWEHSWDGSSITNATAYKDRRCPGRVDFDFGSVVQSRTSWEQDDVHDFAGEFDNDEDGWQADAAVMYRRQLDEEDDLILLNRSRSTLDQHNDSIVTIPISAPIFLSKSSSISVHRPFCNDKALSPKESHPTMSFLQRNMTPRTDPTTSASESEEANERVLPYFPDNHVAFHNTVNKVATATTTAPVPGIRRRTTGTALGHDFDSIGDAPNRIGHRHFVDKLQSLESTVRELSIELEQIRRELDATPV